MPEKTLKKLNASISPKWKICFFTGLLVGLLAHLYKIVNWLPNWDSLVFRYDAQNMAALGRWFLPVVCSATSFYDLPFLNGLISIVFHALSAVCICKILNVQKTITAVLIGAVIVSFPTVTSVMMYNYVADGYSIAFFLAVLAALFMTGEKPGYVPAAVLMALSMGIYQAYVTVTIMLVLLKLIEEIVYRSTPLRTVLRKAIFMFLSGGLGAALYAVILKIVLSVFSIELLDYQGIDSSASLSGINLPASLYVVKETFIKCFFDLSCGVNIYVALNGFIFIVTLIYYLKYIAASKLYKKPADAAVLVVLCALLFVGAGALAFINADIDYHNLMLMGYAVFYLFFLVLYEKGTDKTPRQTCVKCWLVLLTSVVLIANQIVIANVSYHKAQMAYEKSYGVLIRIADRIEQTPQAENCDRILVLGALENSAQYSVNLTPHITGITDGYIIRADDETVNQSVLCSALADYCEKNYKFISGEEKISIAQREDVKSMGCWPSQDCVAVIGGTVIIKLGSEGEN